MSKAVAGSSAVSGGLLSQMHQDDEFDENGGRIMSKKVVQQLLRSSGSYFTPQYNTTLYLNNLQFSCIQGLEDYTAVRTLHLEGNAIKHIQGIAHMTQLRALYLQSNDISCLEGLEACTQLEHLNINGNPVQSLRGLPASLTTLHASSVGLSEAEGLSCLAEMCPALQVLDVSRNRLTDESLPVLHKLKQLRVLYCKECPCTKAPSYRRTLISSLPMLSYLDDSPVDDMERRGAEAWLVGGQAAEHAARLAWRDERRRALRRSTTTFAVERAQRRILRQLSGLLQSDEQLSWVMQLLEGPMQRDTVQALVARIMGDAQPTTVPLDALDGLRTGLYPGSAAANDGALTASSTLSNALVVSNTNGGLGNISGGLGNTSAVTSNTHSGLQGTGSGCQGLNSPEGALSPSTDDALLGGDECVVCSEELVAGAEVLWLPCTHVFHKGCIYQWLTRFSSTCPTCRAPVVAPSPIGTPVTSPRPEVTPVAGSQNSPAADTGHAIDTARTSSAMPGPANAPQPPHLVASRLTVGALLAELATLLPPPATRAAGHSSEALAAAAPGAASSEGETTIPAGGALEEVAIQAVSSGSEAPTLSVSGPDQAGPGAPPVTVATSQPQAAPARPAGAQEVPVPAQAMFVTAAGAASDAAAGGASPTAPSASTSAQQTRGSSPTGAIARPRRIAGTSASISPVPSSGALSRTASSVDITRRAAVVRSGDGDAAVAEEEALLPGCGGANTMDDPTYRQLQQMYRRNFGQKSRAAEAQLGGWQMIKQQRQRQGEDCAADAGGTAETKLNGTITTHEDAGARVASNGGSGVDTGSAGSEKGRDEQVLSEANSSPSQQAAAATQQQQARRQEEAPSLGLSSNPHATVRRTSETSNLQQPAIVANSSIARQQQASVAGSTGGGTPAAQQQLDPILRQSPVQSVLRAVSSVMQQRRDAVPSPSATALNRATTSHVGSANGRLGSSGSHSLTAAGSARQEQEQARRRPASLSVGHLLPSAEQGLDSADDLNVDPWALPTVAAASVPYL